MNYRETLNRLNILLELLQQHHEVGIDELLSYFQVPRCTLIRDIEKLQSLGHEIEYCRKRRAYVLIE